MRISLPAANSFSLLLFLCFGIYSGVMVWQEPLSAIASPVATDQGHIQSSNRSMSEKIVPIKLAQNFQSRRKLRSYNTPRKTYRERLEEIFSEDQMETDRSPWIFHSGRYRTMCVRLCDGYYFPVSFSARPDQFYNDEQVCRSRCAAPVALFVYRNPGSSIDHMRSLAGQKYRHLANAYLYRKKFVASCRCKPEPWTVAERSRHHFYATGKPLPEQGQVKLAGKSSNISSDRLQDPNARLAENMIRDRQAARTVRSNYLIIRFDEMQEVSNGAQQLSEQIIRSKYYRGPAQHSSISNKPAAIRSLNTDSKIRIETPFSGDSR